MEYPMTSTPEKMSGTSLDIAADKREHLKQLFPTVFTETVDATGKLVESVDFEKLKAELGTFTDLFENRRERYGMDWPGKKEALKLIQTVSTATLKPCREESVNFDTTENLFIEGDNLEVLKLLQKSYYGKVKMIYIDPPYNTGNEFIYPDNYSETLETYLEYAGQEGRWKNSKDANTKQNPRVHTKWLNMMYPRLYLARNLLQNDGMIFISIDDNEVTNTRRLCDEIFGEENFIDSVIWKKRYGGGAKEKYLVSIHEYILVYAKDLQEIDSIEIALSEASINRYYNLKDDNFDKRGPYRTHPLEAMKSFEERKNLKFSIVSPEKTDIFPKRQWRWSKERFDDALQKGEVEFIKLKNGEWTVHSKQYLKDNDGDMRTAKVFSIIDNIYTQHGTNEVLDIFGNAQVFPFPKPSKLISKLLEIGTIDRENCIMMDFFAGSAATAHAVFEINQNDNGNRKFILVQLPEPCSDDSEAFKAGYKTIADIGKERIRRVIKKLEAIENGKLPFDSASPQDRGFKVLKLDKSNFKQWQPLPPHTEPETLVKQLKLFIDHIDAKASPEDLLYEILIKAGFPPSEHIESLTLAGKTVYSIAGGGLLLCLEGEVSAELINAVAEAEPMQFICLDAAFGGNDQLKANTVQTFAARNMGKEKHNQTVFKTV